MIRTLFASCVVVMLLAGCAAQGPGMNASGGGKQVNTLLNGKQNHAAAGVGSAISGASLLGASLASSIGPSLDKVDMMYHNQTGQHALETAGSGTTLAWNNPDSGHSGTITPQNVIERSPGEYCREYRQTIKAGDKSDEAFSTACRQPDGSWKPAQ